MMIQTFLTCTSSSDGVPAVITLFIGIAVIIWVIKGDDIKNWFFYLSIPKGQSPIDTECEEWKEGVDLFLSGKITKEEHNANMRAGKYKGKYKW